MLIKGTRNISSEDPCPRPPPQEMQSPVVSQAVICSILTQYISPVKRRERSVPFNFALEESTTSSHSFSCHWTEPLRKLRIAEWLRLGGTPRGHFVQSPCSSRVPYGRLPRAMFRLMFVLVRLLPNPWGQRSKVHFVGSLNLCYRRIIES